MEKIGRKNRYKKIVSVIKKGMATIVACVCLLVIIIVVDASAEYHDGLFEKHSYPEAEYTAMENFSKEIIIPDEGIDFEKLILNSKWDYTYRIYSDIEGNPNWELELGSTEIEHKKMGGVHVKTKLDENYHIISSTRDFYTEKAYKIEYYANQIFNLFFVLFLIFMMVWIIYELLVKIILKKE